MASVRSASLNGGLWSPQRGPGQSGGQGGEAPLKLKAFCQFSYKKWPKVQYLNENLPPCLRQAVWRRHDQP